MNKITQSIRALSMAGSVVLASAVSMACIATTAHAAASTATATPGHFFHHNGGLIPLEGRALAHFLDKVQATDAQRAQIKSLAQVALSDLKPLHATAHSLHDQGLALFTQPTIDAVAQENLRQQSLTTHDGVSQYVLDAGNVLTVDQRTDLVAQIQKHEAAAKLKWQQHAKSTS